MPKPPSASPAYRRCQRIKKQIKALYESEGYGQLLPPLAVKPDRTRARQDLKRTKLILDAIECGWWVPQEYIDEVNPPAEPNPKVPDEDDDGKAPF